MWFRCFSVRARGRVLVVAALPLKNEGTPLAKSASGVTIRGLERKGSRCFAIRSKTSAEQFLRKVRPDLVVLDYQLIGGVGLEAAQIASKKRVPVIITSGHRHIFERVKKAGYFYLMKPFTISELLDMASVALGQELGSFEYPSIQIH
jgi:DNA-binding response OmpR family regulator